MNPSELYEHQKQLRSELYAIGVQIAQFELAKMIETIISDVRVKGYSIDPGYCKEIPGLQLWKLPYRVQISGWCPGRDDAIVDRPMANRWANKLNFISESNNFIADGDWSRDNSESPFYGAATIWVPIYALSPVEDGWYWLIDCDGDVNPVEIKNGLVCGVDPIENYKDLFIPIDISIFD